MADQSNTNKCHNKMKTTVDMYVVSMQHIGNLYHFTCVLIATKQGYFCHQQEHVLYQESKLSEKIHNLTLFLKAPFFLPWREDKLEKS